MKKVISLICAVMLLCSVFVFTGCGENQNGNDIKASIKPADLFSKVWSLYTDDELFPVAGGDMDHANMEAPDVFDINTNKEAFVSSFVVGDDILSAIEGDVITAQHMMNINTFSSAMFNVKDANQIANLAESYNKGIQANHWMCGMPDTVIVLSSGDLMIIAFGKDDLVQTFKSKCISAESTVQVVIEAPIIEG